MLVLEIRSGHKVKIGPDIEVCVVRTKRGRVSLGFTAPKDVQIVRDDAKNRERKERAETARGTVEMPQP